MTRDEVIERFCRLSAEVMRQHFECDHPADCFCSGRAPGFGGFQFSPSILEFIESAVRKKLSGNTGEPK
jgi:hypothetical protein